MRLLIAEDERDIAMALETLLRRNNYGVDTVYNGKDAYEYAVSGNYDGIILDIMMPEMDGLEVLRRLRAGGTTTPVMLLTAKGEVEDRVSGLDAGADDYLPKPFAVSELMARVRAMLRRRDQYQTDLLGYEGLTLNPDTMEMAYAGGRLQLAGREYQVLEMLMDSPGTIVSADKMMDHIWGWDTDVDVSVVWVYISNLRKKLAHLDAPMEIRGVRGVGYCLQKKR